ncbi:hypothetical protein NADFUDRAFT_39597 [Nadsonia fulvescens var. elongata DSM 6958]|uniref:separase n=1 Tax=Nadsonia fulvescens var. elongata DSM 6958 TaxID=857566 RepID=A0A1E3PS02_9ASCO|nr:hypothetical protein NADFUDRAFT_39597 [Nadsonia fulvescens var. elongata DSM 6958]
MEASLLHELSSCTKGTLVKIGNYFQWPVLRAQPRTRTRSSSLLTARENNPGGTEIGILKEKRSLALRIIKLSTELLGESSKLRKVDNGNTLTREQEHVIENIAMACSYAITFLKNIEGLVNSPVFEIEKLQCNLLFKLIDNDLVRAAYAEIFLLYKRLLCTLSTKNDPNEKLTSISTNTCTGGTKRTSNPNLAIILAIKPVDKDISEVLVNLVVTMHVCLLKCFYRSMGVMKVKTLSINDIVLAFNLENGPHSWCNRLSPTVRNQKVTFLAKILFAISDKAVIEESIALQILALSIVPEIDSTWMKVLISSLNQLFKLFKNRQEEMKDMEGIDNLISRFSAYASTYGLPGELGNWESLEFKSQDYTNSNDIDTKSICKLLYIPETILRENCQKLSEIFSNESISSFGNEIKIHKYISSFFQSLVKLSCQFQDNKEALGAVINIMRFYENVFNTRAFGDETMNEIIKFAIVLLDWCAILCKNQNSLLVFNDYQVLYENCFAIASKLNDTKRQLHSSNALYNIGHKLWGVGLKDSAVDCWARSLYMHPRDAETKKYLTKLECYSIGLLDTDNPIEAINVLSESLSTFLGNQVNFSLHKPIGILFVDDFASGILHLIAKIIIEHPDLYPEFQVRNLIKGVILERLLWCISTSTKPGRGRIATLIFDRIEQIYTIDDFPLRYLRALNAFISCVSPAQIENYLDNIYECFQMVNDFDFREDEILEKSAAYIMANTLLRINLLHRDDPSKVLQELSNVVALYSKILPRYNEDQSFIDKPEYFMSNCLTVIGFLDFHGLHVHKLKIANLLDKHVHQEMEKNSLTIYNSITKSYLALGFTGYAAGTLIQSKPFLKSNEVSVPIHDILIWYLLEVEFLAMVGSVSLARKKLGQLKTYVEDDQYMSLPFTAGIGNSEKPWQYHNRIYLFGYSAYIASILCLEEGNIEESFRHARKSLKISSWLLSQLAESKGPSAKLSSNESNVRLWQTMSLINTDQIHLALLLCHMGNSREAEYYLQEAQKSCETMNCPLRMATIQITMGEFYTRLDRYELGLTLLRKAENFLSEVESVDHNVVRLWYAYALFFQKNQQFSEEMSYYEKIGFAIDSIISNSGIGYPNMNYDASTALPSITERVSRLSIPADFQQANAIEHNNSVQMSGIDRFKGLVLRSKVFSLGLQDGVEEAIQVLSEESVISNNIHDSILQSVIEARNYLLLARKMLAFNPAFPSLQESAISIPAVASKSLGLNRRPSTATSPSQNRLTRSVTRLRSVGTEASRHFVGLTESTLLPSPALQADSKLIELSDVTKAIHNLQKARDLILSYFNQFFPICSSSEIFQISNLFGNITVLLSAISDHNASFMLGGIINEERFSSKNGVLTPMLTNYFLELSKGYALDKDKVILELLSRQSYDGNWFVDICSSQDDESVKYQTPKRVNNNQQSSTNNLITPKTGAKFKFSTDKFRREYIDIIPHQWYVISINCCPDTGDLLITRFEAYKTPFMLRLPLIRHATRNNNKALYSVDGGLVELRDIINKSDATALATTLSHIRTREDRENWWSERYKLDDRLKSFLDIVETNWLGGFKGIFTPKIFNHSLKERFKFEVIEILSRHLESRKSNSKPCSAPSYHDAFRSPTSCNKNPFTGTLDTEGTTPIVEVHDKVFELFLGLGDPYKLESSEIMDDLVYFLLDILHFHGEMISYDESEIGDIASNIKIDIEKMMSHFYKESYFQEFNGFEHCILILDKKCQEIPWESIPCLRNLSVSRIPSLSVLKSQISLFTNKVDGGDFRVSKNKGCYILNPSLDLVRTQERLKPRLEAIRGKWTGFVSQVPSEEALSKALETNDMLVYIGHGGGDQYIRSSKIKSLKRCCPTLLLGCSSGTLKTAGEFEPYGTPISYLIAGCPMVVANLWDVTDKDIDKLSISMMEKWGLMIDNNEPDNGESGMSITQGLSESRDICKLRYLNGASTVVYGLPLKLKE